MELYSSNGMKDEPLALVSGRTVRAGMFDPTDGKKIPMEGEELRSARMDILQKNEKKLKSAENMTIIGGVILAAVVVIAIITFVKASESYSAEESLLLFELLFAMLAQFILAGGVLLFAGLSSQKKLKSLAKCVITAYRFRIKGKFYQVKTYPKGKLTCYYVEFGNNIAKISEKQYNGIKTDGDIYCVIAEQENEVYFTLTGLIG